MHMRATERWPGGFFASYHAYPYYPDFLGLDPGYADYTRPDGKVDPYAGYLHELRAHHQGQAVMITEFGQPTGIGIAHYGPLGRDQGGHSEQEAAANNADMLSAIRQEGYRRRDRLRVDRRVVQVHLEHRRPRGARRAPPALAQRPHQRGALRRDRRRARRGPGGIVTVDGDDSEWVAGHSPVIQEGRGAVREVRAIKDEEYLYLRLRLDEPLDDARAAEHGLRPATRRATGACRARTGWCPRPRSR